ncbi:glycosyltransferase [Microbacterium sulfonylureivorans]|uniref:glycosyltransferase family 2 protein n=1 Tax=Microbacterium sulfonylureivorans TaxID=2486854 RepID=UPI000FD7876A|nr:cellulose synthase catalytic subunit [Microbacterium sulfonylureivorans]
MTNALPRTHLTRFDPAGRLVRSSETSALFVLISVIATLGVVAYSLFLLNPENRGDVLPYLLVLVAESILVFQALLSMWTILSSGYEPRDFPYHEAKRLLLANADDDSLHLDGRVVLVDVFITVYGEELSTVRRTVEAAVALRGAHRTWVLDDGRSDAVKDSAAELGAWYVRRLSGNGAKAGNLNHALSIAKGDLFAVFDADFVPDPDFLIETVPFFTDENVAFVQTPQAYGNLTTVIARGAAFMQTVFYRFAQRGRNRFNAAFCVGTNVIFRRAAIDDIGGMHTDSKSEDVWTALSLHERGWRSIYIPDVLAVGDAPETIEAFSKQQLRWATGGFEILLTHNPLNPKRRLTGDQRIQYFVTATFYLTGICPLLLILVPPLEIYFDLRPMDLTITPLTWGLYYAGFYAMQILLAWFVVGSFRWETLTLSTVSFPIYTKALWNVITGKDVGWHVTGTATRRSPFNFIVPQLLFFVFLALTSVVAIWRDANHGSLTLATAWNVTNTLILAAFIGAALHEHRAAVHPRPAPAPAAEAAPSAVAPVTIVARPLPAPVLGGTGGAAVATDIVGPLRSTRTRAARGGS